jgi:murein DD-endopeptidase MepM/ murein hydrolase activator NlpD
MNKKIIGIFVCVLFFGASVLPGSQNIVHADEPNPLTISGRLRHNNENGILIASKYIKIEAWEKQALIDYKIAEGFTDNLGEFTFTHDTDGDPILNEDPGVGESGTRDIYIKFFAENEAARVSDDWIPGILGITYWGDTDTDYDVPGPIYFKDITITEDTRSPCLGIPSNIKDDRDWLSSHTGGWTRDQLGVLYPDSDWPKFFSIWFYNVMRIPDNYADRVTTLSHEYGHGIHWSARGGGLPDSNPKPIGEEDPRDGTPQAGQGAHWVFSESSGGFALTEGWAEYFQCARHGDHSNLETNDYWMGADDDVTRNGPGPNDDVWIPDGINEDGQTGEIVEGAFASILWDLYDGVGDDDYGGSFSNIWTVFETDDPDRVWSETTNNDFYHYWNSRFGQSREVDEIFIDHGIPVTDDSYDSGSGNDDSPQASNLGLVNFIKNVNDLIVVDLDWYEFSTSAKGDENSKVVIEFDENRGDLDLFVYHSDDTLVDIGASIPGGKEVSLDGEYADDFKIKVAGVGDDDGTTTYEGDFSPNYKLIIKTSQTRTYTLDSDFDEGILIGLEHDTIHNQLQLSDKSSTYPTLWVANAGEDSLSKWDTENNVELARYHTWFGSLGYHSAWSGPAPSRTCVDSDGNCYVANRHFDTYKPDVIKVYTDTWVDRNGNGILDTSYDANDNGVIEESEMLPMTDSNYNGRIDPEEITDERIAWATQVNGGGVGRSLAIDLDGNIWLGCYNSYRYYKLDGDDGSIIGGPYYVYGHTPYGALVDKHGYLWGSSLSSNILKLNTNNPAEYEIYSVPYTYGIALGYDSQDNTLVYCGYNYPYVVFNSKTETYSNPAESWDRSLGVAVDSEGNIAVGSYYDGDVAKYASDGTIIWAVTGQINSEVRGIVFDSDDNIWAIHRDTSKLCKYNGENGAYMGVYDAGLYPYTYTDATGLGYQGSIGVGIWEVIFDSGTSNTEWGVVSWDSYTPPDTSLWIEVRSSNDGSSWSSWETAVNGNNLGSTPDGRYLKIRTTMKILSGETSPVLYDLTVSTSGSPIHSEQPQLKAPWLGIQRITQGNNAPQYPPYSHYDHGTWDNTYAIDVYLPVGSDVRAPADGVISWYDDDSGGSGGIELAIDHIGPTGKTYTTVYLHLSEIIVKSGTVEQGDLIARSGDTGYVTDPHLHYHIWNGIGSRDSHTQPIDRLVMKKYGDVDFKEYDARDNDLDNYKVEGKFFESNILSLEEMEWIEAQIQSPVELRVYNSDMQVSGVIDGEEIIEIPNSVYINETVMIFSMGDNFAYSIVGIDNDTYNLTITKKSPTGDVVFNAFDISTKIGNNHLYNIDWGALSNGDEGVAIAIDNDGDGVFERTITSDDELTQDEFILLTETTIDIDPDTLNINSSGKWITCYIELPDGFNVSNINLSTILLNDIVSIETKPINISDYDNDTIPDLMVKFNRKDVIDILELGDNVEIIVSGELKNGTKFEGVDYIKVI